MLRVEILGIGNVRDLPAPPRPVVAGGFAAPFRDYAWVETRDGVVGGVRVFEYQVTLVEDREGVVQPIVFSYFDPYLGDFGVVTTGELVIGAR